MHRFFMTLSAFAIASGALAASTHTSVERQSFVAPVTDAAEFNVYGPGKYGSGFYIGKGRVVTAAHVVTGVGDLHIKTPSGLFYDVTIVAIDKKKDIAILHTSVRGIPAAEIDCGRVAVGTKTMTIGSPLGLDAITTYGTIAGAPRKVSGILAYVVDETTVKGHSGAAVFVDGKVIGVKSQVLKIPIDGGFSISGLSLVVPSSVVCDMLSELKDGM